MKSYIKLFIATVKMEFNLLVHSWWIWGILVFFILYLFTGYYAFFINERMYGQLLQSSAYIVMGSILLGIFAGMNISGQERKVAFEEVVETYVSYKLLPIGKVFAWLLVVCFFVILSIIAMLVAYVSVGSQLILFWQSTAIYIVIYWGLPFLAAGLIGYALDKTVRGALRYVMAFVIWQLTSPYNTYLPEKMHYLLNQGQESPNSTYDVFVGLNICMEILIRHLFFLLLAIFLVLLAVRIHYRLNKKQILTLSVSMLIIFSLGIMLIPCSNYKTDYDIQTASDVSKEALSFYNKYKDISYEQIEPGFKVESYNINLSHHQDKISYEAKIEISIPKDKALERIYFSLYHGLKVMDLTGPEDETEWKQEGDTIYINWNPNIHKGAININVSGSTGYKNRIGSNNFSLSSIFAWYPIPGKKILADDTLLWNVQFRNLSLSYPVEFNVKVNSNKKVYSNLSKTGDNQFQGKDYGVTLVCGNLLKTVKDGVTIIAPPDMDIPAEEAYQFINKKLKEISANTNKNKKINVNTIFVVPLDDHSYGDTIPMEYVTNQLFISARELAIYGSNYFDKEDFIVSTFYWFNQYRHEDNTVPIVLTCLYNKLYNCEWGNTFERIVEQWTSKYETFYEGVKTPRPTASDKQLYEIAQNVIELYNEGYESELKEMLREYFELADKSELNVYVIEQYINEIKSK